MSPSNPQAITIPARTLLPKYGGRAGVGSFLRNLLKGFDEIGIKYSLTPSIDQAGIGNRFVGETLDLMKMAPSDCVLYPNYFAAPVLPGKFGKRVAVVHDTLFRDHPETVSAQKRAWQNALYTWADAYVDELVFISTFSMEQFSRHFGGKNRRKFSIIGNPIDTSRYKLREFKPDRERPQICTLSAFYPHKNFELFLNIAKERFGTYDFVVIGRRPDQLTLERMAKQVGCDPLSLVRWTGYVEDQEVTEIMSSSDLFLFTSSYEGFGMPPLEAVALGVPVISSALPSVLEAASGLCDFVPMGTNPQVWAELVDERLANPAPQEYLAARSKVISERFSPGRIAEKYAKVCFE